MPAITKHLRHCFVWILSTRVLPFCLQLPRRLQLFPKLLRGLRRNIAYEKEVGFQSQACIKICVPPLTHIGSWARYLTSWGQGLHIWKRQKQLTSSWCHIIWENTYKVLGPEQGILIPKMCRVAIMCQALCWKSLNSLNHWVQ